MSTQVTLDKTDFIKFNVSPTFKKLAAKKAATTGMSLSELGRMLFGLYIHDLLSTSNVHLDQLAQKAQENHEKGIGKTFTDTKEMTNYLENL